MFKLNSIQMGALSFAAGSTFGADSLTVALDSLVQSVQNLQESFPVPPGPGPVLEMTWLHEETPPPIVEDNAPKPKKVQTPQEVEEDSKDYFLVLQAKQFVESCDELFQNEFFLQNQNAPGISDSKTALSHLRSKALCQIQSVEQRLAAKISQPSSS